MTRCVGLRAGLVALVAVVGCGDPAPTTGDAPQEVTESTESDALERLQQLGYVSGTKPAPDGEEATVTVHDGKAVEPGWNLYSSGHAPEAILMDMEGVVHHRWRCDVQEVWSDVRLEPGYDHLRRVHLLEDGDLLVIFEGIGLLRLDRESRVRWALRIGAHHDLEVQPDGSIYVLTRTAHIVPQVHPERPILEDFISVVTPDGQETVRCSLLECAGRAGLKLQLADDGFQEDPFHTNALRVLDPGFAGIHSGLKPDMVLVSLRNLHLLAYVDLEQRRVVKTVRGGFRMQHDPELLASGRILLFDNLGLTDSSRILEVDALGGETVWEFRGAAGRPFFSRLCGNVQRLPQGNTLITVSGSGQVLEVDGDGRIVWEFRSPHRSGPAGERIADLFDWNRLPVPAVGEWIGGGR